MASASTAAHTEDERRDAALTEGVPVESPNILHVLATLGQATAWNSLPVSCFDTHVVNATYNGNTALAIAARVGNVAGMDMMLRQGASMLIKDSHHLPMRVAIQPYAHAHRDLALRACNIVFRQYQEEAVRRLRILRSGLLSVPDFTAKVQFEFSSIIPLLGRLLPHDTATITKVGDRVRFETTLVGFEGTSWVRGKLAFVFQPVGRAGNMWMLDEVHRRAVHASEMDESQTHLLHDADAAGMERPSEPDRIELAADETEDMLDSLLATGSNGIEVDSKHTVFERSKKGLLRRREAPPERVGSYVATGYNAKGLHIRVNQRSPVDPSRAAAMRRRQRERRRAARAAVAQAGTDVAGVNEESLSALEPATEQRSVSSAGSVQSDPEVVAAGSPGDPASGPGADSEEQTSTPATASTSAAGASAGTGALLGGMVPDQAASMMRMLRDLLFDQLEDSDATVTSRMHWMATQRAAMLELGWTPQGGREAVLAAAAASTAHASEGSASSGPDHAPTAPPAARTASLQRITELSVAAGEATLIPVPLAQGDMLRYNAKVQKHDLSVKAVWVSHAAVSTVLIMTDAQHRLDDAALSAGVATAVTDEDVAYMADSVAYCAAAAESAGAVIDAGYDGEAHDEGTWVAHAKKVTAAEAEFTAPDDGALVICLSNKHAMWHTKSVQLTQELKANMSSVRSASAGQGATEDSDEECLTHVQGLPELPGTCGWTRLSYRDVFDKEPAEILAAPACPGLPAGHMWASKTLGEVLVELGAASSQAAAEDAIRVGRYAVKLPKGPTMNRSVKAKVMMAEDGEFPLKLEWILPVAQALARTGKHMQNFASFLETKLPPGFPVAFDLPIVLGVTAHTRFLGARVLSEADVDALPYAACMRGSMPPAGYADVTQTDAEEFFQSLADTAP